MVDHLELRNILGRLTIIVPTFNRQKFACRLIDYWAQKGPQIIVLDGSPEPISHSFFLKYPNTIKYIHRPVSLNQRILEALELISTEFAILAGDDEFYIPSALVSCILQMDRNPELAACGGMALGFWPQNNTIMGKTQYPRLRSYAVDADSAEERLVSHMKEYIPCNVYAVCRSKFWKTSFYYALQEEFSFFSAGEIQFEMCMSFAGKSKIIPELMWLRSLSENAPIRGTSPSLNRNITLPDWWNNKNYNFEKNEFIRIMEKAYAELTFSTYSRQYCRKSALNGVEAYIDFCNNLLLKKEKTQKQESVINYSFFKKKMIMNFLKSYIFRNYCTISPKKRGKPLNLQLAAKRLEQDGIIVDFEALSEIELSIKKKY